MPKKPQQLAKLSRPRLYDALPRERLFRLLDEKYARPAIWIFAPPGAGKTTLVAGWLESRSISGIWYQVDAGDADPASVFYHLGLAERALPHKNPKSRPLPLLTPEHLADVPGFARRYFRELFTRLAAPAALVLDNFQEAGVAPVLHQIVRIAIENAPQGVCVIVVSRILPGEDYALQAANQTVAFLDWESVRLTRDETHSIAQLHKRMDKHLLDELHVRSAGWAAGLILLAERLRRGARMEDLSAPDSLQEVFGYFAGQLFDRTDAETRQMLLQLSYLPSIPASIAESLTGKASSARLLLEQLYRRHLFTDRRHGSEPVYQFHALFRAFLQHRATIEMDPVHQRSIAKNAAGLLEAKEQFEDAMSLRLSAGEWEAAENLILKVAPQMIGQSRWRIVEDWIAALPAGRVASNCWLLHWRGTAWIGMNPPHARSILEQCHQAARDADDLLCEVQAAAGMVEAYFLEYAVFTPLDRWIPVLEKMFDLPGGTMDLNAELRAQSAMLIALVYRMPDHPRIEHCVRRVDELLRTGADVNLRVTAATYLTLYGSFTGHLHVSRRAAAQLTPLLSDPAVTVFRRIFAWAVTNWYACNSSDVALGNQAVASNLAIARDEGLHIAERFACIIGFYFDMDQRRVESARERLLRFEEIMDPTQPYELASLVNMKSWFGVYTEDPSLPLQHGVRAYELYLEAGSIPHIFMGLNGLIWGTVESGDHAAGRHWIGEHRRWSYRSNMEWSRGGPDAAEAIMALRDGDLQVLDDRLNGIFACERDRMDQYGHMLAWCRSWASTLAAAAMERGIQVPRAIAYVREFGLEPPRSDLEVWPWPIRIRTLGEFRIEIDDKPLSFARKAPRKVLALLKAILALGGRSVPEQRLMDALWPDEPADAARESLAANLHRLRKLLVHANAIQLSEGLLSVSPRHCWVDAWELERLTADSPGDEPAGSSQRERVLALYAGPFLPEEVDSPWALSARTRYADRFLRYLTAAARRQEESGRPESAVSLYQRGIEIDELAEPLYQGLMRCYQRLGRNPEALAVYKRLSRTLSMMLGTRPSTASEALARSLLRA